MLNRLAKRWLVPVALMISISACDGQSDAEKTQALLEEAEARVESGQTDAAVIKLKNALQLAPEHAEARRRLGELHLEKGNAADAVKEFERAIQYGATAPSVRVNLARALLDAGRAQDVIDEPELSLQEGGMSDAAYRELAGLRAQALIATEQPEQAQRLATDAVQAGPATEARIALASLASSNGDNMSALEHLREALEQEPTNVRALMMQARAYVQSGELQDAMATLATAREASAGVGSPDLMLVEVALRAGETEKAWSILGELNERGAQDPRVQYFTALQALSEDRYQDARNTAESLVGQYPEFTQAALVAGAANLELGNNELARNYLQRVVSANPDNPRAQALLAQALMGLGEESEARSIMESVRNAGLSSGTPEAGPEAQDPSADQVDAPEEYQNQVRAIVTDIRSQRYEAAIRKARALGERMDDRVLPLQLEAITLWSRGDREDAVRTMESALEQAPANAGVAINLARMHRELGDAKAALDVVNASIDANPQNAALLVEAAQAHAVLGEQVETQKRLEEAIERAPQSPEPRVFLARLHLLAGRPDEALKVIADAQEDQKGVPAFLEIKGRAQLARGDQDAALSTFRALADAVPDRAEPRRWIGRLLLAMDRPDDAVEAFEDARSLSDGAREVELELARAVMEAGQEEKAATLLDELEEKYPDDAQVAVLRGNFELAFRQDAEAAIAAFEAAYEGQPTQDSLLTLVRAYQRVGDPESALSALRRWREQNEAGPAVLQASAELELARGNMETARDLYEELVAARPSDATARNNLAWILSEQGQLDAAFEHAKRAVELAPDVPEIRDTIGMVLLKRGEADQAVGHLKEAVAGAPSRSDIRLNYVEALVASGDEKEAKEILAEIDKDGLSAGLTRRFRDLRARVPE